MLTPCTDCFADEGVLEWFFYMPKEATEVAAGPTSNEGDRLNKGDVVYMLGAPSSANTFGAASLTENCGSGTVSIGATALAASSIMYASLLMIQ